MSRIGKMPVTVPSGVEVIVDGASLRIRGPKGELQEHIPSPITVELQDGSIIVRRPSDERRNRALHGLTRALVANMVTGVTKGFEKVLELRGVGYRAQVDGRHLTMFLGFSHPVEMNMLDGLEAEVVPDGSNQLRITVRGVSKQAVGQFAAEVRAKRPADPYKGKGLRYVGERVKHKAGKSAVGGGAPGSR